VDPPTRSKKIPPIGVSCHIFIQRHFSTGPANVEDNVNLTDVDHHEKFAVEWWDPLGPMKGLHAMNGIRVPMVCDGLIATGLIKEGNIESGSVLEGMNILEVGCGAGIFTKALSDLKTNVTALDPSEVLLGVAKCKVPSDNVKFVCETIEKHAENNKEKYDAVVACEVIEHVVDQKSFLAACAECLKPGGSIFVTTFNKTPFAWFGGIIVAEYILRFVPKNSHDYKLFISPSAIERILKQSNCSTVSVRGLFYQFWRNKWVWSSNKSAYYALQAVKN
jgi:polyprenyldihydroxybenzoate methyltransferase / 3-demethylubiquinol 3-O-methyltransferase